MRTALAFFLAVQLLAGCASAPAPDPEAAAFMSWLGGTKQQAEAGQVPFTAFYTEAYDRLSRIASSDPQKLALQRAFAEMIPVARAYEAGTLTREQFDDTRRITNTALQEHGAALEAQRQRAIADAMEMANRRTAAPAETSCVRVGTSVSCVTR